MIRKVTEGDEKAIERCVEDLIKWLAAKELFQDVNIYANGLCYSSNMHGDCACDETITPHATVFIRKEPNPETIVEYFNPKLINMTFEGPLYHALNYGYRVEPQLNEFFEKRGLYFEYGYAWSLSTYMN